MDTPNALAPRPPLPLLGPVTVRCRARSRCPRRDGHDHSRGCQRRCPAGHRGHWAVPVGRCRSGGAGRVNPTMVTTTRFLAGSGESKINMKYTSTRLKARRINLCGCDARSSQRHVFAPGWRSQVRSESLP